MTHVTRQVRLLGCVLMVAVLTACGAGSGQGGEERQGKKERKAPTMDMQQAGQRSEAVLDGTLAAIRPAVKWAYGAPVESACSTGLNEPTGTTTVTRSRNILTVVSEQRRGNLLGLVQRHWEGQGFRVVSVNTDKDMPRIEAKGPDGVTVSLEVGSIGNVSLNAGLSCAENSAMTYPTGTPGRPGGPRTEEVRPREHSAFWSSEEPLRQ
ncbi:hypothetical protein OG195_26405 [Streptomyces sp. NBC_01362]|uniref:hypothetical protein n=1 Tax=Streptomyces sp. NBC_01362 TaxID=2903839 RepID=UPI002E35ED4D|nr:hypothetical protein [Streptomyces sp. NBC_01362]